METYNKSTLSNFRVSLNESFMNTEAQNSVNRVTKHLNERPLKSLRIRPIVKVIEPASDDEDGGPELFIAQPTDDIPRNKLIERLARGLQAYV